MSRYYTPSLYFLSIAGGITVGIFASLFTSLASSVISGAVAAMIIATLIPSMLAISDRKLIPLIKEIGEPILTDERVNILVGNEMRSAFIVTTKNALYVISVDGGKPVRLEIKKESVKKLSVSDETYLNIFVDYNKFIRVFCGDCEELFTRLSDEGFGKY